MKTKEELLTSLLEAQAIVNSAALPSYFHCKTGTVYTVVGCCLIEETCEAGVLYEKDGLRWVRPLSEFLQRYLPEKVAGPGEEQRGRGM